MPIRLYIVGMLPTHPVEANLDRLGLKQSELARHMGVDPSTLSKKLSGDRGWSQADINSCLAFFRAHEPGVTYEQLFASVEAVA